jgi:hypothetical protein
MNGSMEYKRDRDLALNLLWFFIGYWTNTRGAVSTAALLYQNELEGIKITHPIVNHTFKD